jgi:hypothetical protein
MGGNLEVALRCFGVLLEGKERRRRWLHERKMRRGRRMRGLDEK